DDDSGDLQYASKVTYNLTAGTTYVLVVTPYANGYTGSFVVQATSAVFPITNSWFTAASGGSSIFTGNVFNPVGVAGSGIPNTATPGSTDFYVQSNITGACRTKTTFTITAPSVGGTVAGSQSVCIGANSGTLTLSGHTGSIVRWESSTDNFVSNIVTIANTTTTLNFSNLSQTTKYRAVVKNGNCAAINSAVATITVITASAPTPTNGSRCGTGSVTLTATGCAGGTINWYAGVSGGTSLGTGTSFNTPSIATTTTYYVGCSLIGASPCQSVRVPVVATVNVNLTFSGSQAAGNYRVSQTITSTANVATGVNYYAAKAIVMNPGFQAGGSEVFLAKIEDCP
ncbi:immunoglobulin domain-containing protein, partial [Emticicia agri]|uniref:immunoglobulin domain-containing protein n=1 Tax=Emticicia agri TaxID=2492393 RepID=UPI0035B6922F